MKGGCGGTIVPSAVADGDVVAMGKDEDAPLPLATALVTAAVGVSGCCGSACACCQLDAMNGDSRNEEDEGRVCTGTGRAEPDAPRTRCPCGPDPLPMPMPLPPLPWLVPLAVEDDVACRS